MDFAERNEQAAERPRTMTGSEVEESLVLDMDMKSVSESLSSLRTEK